MENNPLLGRFLRAFPKQFLLRLIERQPALYAQSIALAFNESWSRAEAFSVLPSIRRALWESETRQSAVACGLRCPDEPHAGENCTCVTVKTDGLILTVHYVDGPKQLVREAESRKQNAGVNQWLAYHTDERLLTSPIPKLNSRPIYLNLLHGAIFPTSMSPSLTIDETTHFLRVAIPAIDSTKYLYNWSAQELLQSYAAAPQVVQPAVTLEDKARPKRRAEAADEKKKTRGSAE